MSYMPDLAIVVTTFRRVELLRTLLDSIDALDMQPNGIIVVDNDNSDEVKNLVESYRATYYIGMEENTGGAGGFSRGIAEAYRMGFTWLWVMDDDVKVLPGAIEKLAVWTKRTEDDLAAGKALSETVAVYQGFRKNFDGSFFYWQYHFMPRLAMPNPFAPSAFGPDEHERPMNTACFEGSLFHRSLVKEIGLPDARFFIYWDDTMYGYLASKHTQLRLVSDYILQRTRTLANVKIGRVRKLNSTSNMARYHIMRNRGHMAQYLRLNGEYNPFLFGMGTVLTFAKEFIRLFVTKEFKSGFPRLIAGMRDARTIRKDKDWRPYSEIAPCEES